MDIFKEIKKQAEDILKDDKKKEQAGDAVENLLKEEKKHVKDEKSSKTIDKLIKTVDDATTSKKSDKK